MLYPNVSPLLLTKEQWRLVFKVARVFAWSEERPGFRGKGTNKQRQERAA
jgi:hypothetical protein